MNVPEIRIRQLTDRPVNDSGDYVLYWMTAFRRAHYNFSLQRAAEWASELDKPLLVFEALRCDYQWASHRLHRFVIEGMRDNAADFADQRLTYYPYLEEEQGGGKGLIRELTKNACVLVSDDFPCFFLPRMFAAVDKRLDIKFELVDSNGLYPMHATDKVFSRAFDLRRHLQKELLPHLAEPPKRSPLKGYALAELDALPKKITKEWKPADLDAALDGDKFLSKLPIDHDVRPAPITGGSHAGRKQLEDFLKNKLSGYGELRNQPQEDAASGLSPYLHFGHVSVHEVFAELVDQEEWNPSKVSGKVNGSRDGWWGLDESVEGFLDEIITWRELGLNMSSHRDDYDQYESLPDWAQATLAEHADDQREHTYTLEEFEQANTHNDLWNAAQRQLVRDGSIHNYLRMLWGKKILHWSKSPREALAIMIELNNKYAVDGRNPNSYSGIFWTLGRYDRAWGPEREIFGKIRYMTCDNTARKVKVDKYLQKYSAGGSQGEFDF
ncbi:Deoxyribodipyrimidine photo-lyase [Posidoniimonas polymericola]|uniref:Deoxyribodipyrimidine photo-lyase n=1 Tax=Posidoniimonas polymericola TaxID=2528002 RepID=A0A5C5XXA1_9BACT|nr:deoxyribodipyrimidine photolyase [Posidoniimonas polymericola]TWT66983.1 Deoxyribodipyrimidine photo-lyase [Posidoniimonas polymericola]